MKAPAKILTVIGAIDTALCVAIAVRFSFDRETRIASGAAIAVMAAVSAVLWLAHKRSSHLHDDDTAARGARLGFWLGLAWCVEIGINNLLAPPMPARDIIDDLFWAGIAAAIFVQALLTGIRPKSFACAVRVGAWSGIASGMLACTAALSLIVFGMRFMLHDPLNVAEWNAVRANQSAPSMAHYFAFETLAGAFGHLLVLGLAMGSLLGLVAAIFGTVATKLFSRTIESI